MRGSRVFVSGGAGVIGLELVPKLVARGAEVLVGDLKPRPNDFAPGVRYRQGDLNTMTRAELAHFAPDIFIHMAATFERSVESPSFWEESFRHNVELSHHLMTLLRDISSLRRVVFASSYLIYDPALYQFDKPPQHAVALSEGDPILPRNLVGMAKLSHEMELRFLSGFADCQFSTLNVRIYRGYGRNSRDVISRWVRALLAGEAITVFRPEGLFDYIYAKDSAEGLIRLAEAERVLGVVNLGTGRSRRVADVVAVLRAAFPAMIVEEADSDIPFEASQADTELLRATVGWVPEYDLETAIPEIIAHERVKIERREVPADQVWNVLVTSSSRKVPLVQAMKAAASKLDGTVLVVAGDLDASAVTRFVADNFWAMPPPVPEQIDALLDGCKARNVRVILPTRDGELAFWAEMRERFAVLGITVVVSDAESVERCLDKLEFARFGEDAGLPVIATAEHPSSLDSGPFVVKERFGAGSRSLGLRLGRAAALAHGRQLERPVYQPFIEGAEISIDAWMDASCIPRGLILRRRDRIVDGESQITTTFRDRQIEAEALAALTALKLRGPAVMQAIIDTEGRMRIIECNARFGGASTAAIMAGLDMLYWSLLETYKRGAQDVFCRIEGEVQQVRVPTDIILYDPDI